MEMIDSLGISWQGLIVNIINYTLFFMLTFVPAIWILVDARKREVHWSKVWHWVILTLMFSLLGFGLYLLWGRPKQSTDGGSSQRHSDLDHA